MKIRNRHWLVAFSAAVIAHLSLLLLFWTPAESGSVNLGVGGTEISFGMAGGAPGTAEVVPPPAETVEPQETQAETPPETAPEPPVETAEAVDIPEVEAVEPIAAEVVPVKKVTPPLEKATVRKKPTPPKEIQPPAPVAEPAPRTAPVSETTEVASKSDTAPSVAGSSGQSGTQKSANVGNAADTSSGGRPGSADSYYALLQAWLEKHKEYPSSARRRRNEGVAVLTFTMDKNGAVRNARVTKTSGFDLLDAEVIAMIKRATPLPPFPNDFTDQQMTVSVPVQFRIR